MLFIIEGIALALLIQIFKGFNSTLPRPAGFSNFCGRGSPFFHGAGRTSLVPASLTHSETLLKLCSCDSG